MYLGKYLNDNNVNVQNKPAASDRKQRIGREHSPTLEKEVSLSVWYPVRPDWFLPNKKTHCYLYEVKQWNLPYSECFRA